MAHFILIPSIKVTTLTQSSSQSYQLNYTPVKNKTKQKKQLISLLKLYLDLHIVVNSELTPEERNKLYTIFFIHSKIVHIH